jgi:hypothetical protein
MIVTNCIRRALLATLPIFKAYDALPVGMRRHEQTGAEQAGKRFQ